jgi:predicted nucleotidyltransferase
MERVSKEMLQEITSRLVAQFQPDQVILFGSHAWGTPTRDSDIDLMVIVPNSDLSEYERAVLGLRCLGGINIPKDILVRTRSEFNRFRDVRASLEHKISKQGKILYDRRQEPAR